MSLLVLKCTPVELCNRRMNRLSVSHFFKYRSIFPSVFHSVNVLRTSACGTESNAASTSTAARYTWRPSSFFVEELKHLSHMKFCSSIPLIGLLVLRKFAFKGLYQSDVHHTFEYLRRHIEEGYGPFAFAEHGVLAFLVERYDV